MNASLFLLLATCVHSLGLVGPRWTYDESIEKPQGSRDRGSYFVRGVWSKVLRDFGLDEWMEAVYTQEQQDRLGVDELGESIAAPAAVAAASEKSGAASEKSGAASEKSGAASEKSGAASEKSGAASEKSGAASEKSAVASEKSAAASEKSAAASEKSAASEKCAQVSVRAQTSCTVCGTCTPDAVTSFALAGYECAGSGAPEWFLSTRANFSPESAACICATVSQLESEAVELGLELESVRVALCEDAASYAPQDPAEELESMFSTCAFVALAVFTSFFLAKKCAKLVVRPSRAETARHRTLYLAASRAPRPQQHHYEPPASQEAPPQDDHKDVQEETELVFASGVKLADSV